MRAKKQETSSESRRKRERTYGPDVFLFNLKNIFCKWLYSPDTNSFHSGSALNPDSSICMNCSDSPWLFAVCGLCFAEDTFIYH